MIFRKLFDFRFRKHKKQKLIITFDDANRVHIKAKNCVQDDFYLVASKLSANAKKLPVERNLTFFNRLSKVLKCACSRTNLEAKHCNAK